MKMANRILLGMGAMLLLTGMTVAQSTTTEGDNKASAPSRTGGVLTADRKFMDKAAQGGMAEVEMGQLAEQNAQNPNVKAFGKRMVEDHTKANDQLKQLASQKGVALPTSLDAKEQATKNRLSKLQGAAFDKAYMKDMVADHQQDVAEFKKASSSAHDADLKNWASETLPTLQSHLQEAEKIDANVGGANAMSKNNSGDATAQSH
jgi:putative membrane protein